ncbi:hypothetical protein BDV28DRAFT_159272 [Aspergillus coremiiformis]|uniref:Zn(2)-C6 fungal-type domain-containing protein n=1 Tax=Aspergillus coremiiformis TaxID=138285 RepID=A0A5N6Z4B8_9EURO|nr:hypothetical protein BDV28DRAFT_159272 [Aspergillus coremiiformis]
MPPRSTMKGRRSHQKSRTGCLQCKQRKVKCGEEKPSCGNCKRHGVDCVFAASGPTNASGSQDDHRSLPATQPHSPASESLPPISSGSELQIADLELLHHYTTSTAYTFSLHPLLQTFWRVEVPRLGFTAPYTLRAILAISAQHLAFLRPEKTKDYIAQASTHHKVSLQLATPEMAKINRNNSSPLFLFSALSTFIACARPLQPDTIIEHGHVANWLLLIRGAGTILDFAEETLKTGPVGTMFRVRAEYLNFEPRGRHHALEDLHKLVQREEQDPHIRRMYSGAIDEMNRSYLMCMEHNLRLETADVFIWLIRVPYDFIALFQDHQPLAMVIVGYFCVLLHHLEWMWFMKGRSVHILSQIYARLSPTYRVWIRWPIEQIGFLPPN